MSPRTGVVARWVGAARSDRPVICGECGEAVAPGGSRCPGCYEIAAGPVGMLATLIDTPTGPGLVVAERDPHGGWVPVRAVPATGEAVRTVRRLQAAPAAAAGRGGLL
jgi:hypothetical protein